MPVVNTDGVFNVGRDLTMVLVGQFGRVDVPNLTAFNSRQETASIRSDRLDGIQLLAELPKGWSGTIDGDRGNRVIDDFFASTEAAWITSCIYNVSVMYVYLLEPGGALSTWIYDNVALRLDDAGNYRGDAVVTQRIMWRANRRRGA